MGPGSDMNDMIATIKRGGCQAYGGNKSQEPIDHHLDTNIRPFRLRSGYLLDIFLVIRLSVPIGIIGCHGARGHAIVLRIIGLAILGS